MIIKVFPELKQKLNKSEVNLEVAQKKSSHLSVELDQAEDQHDVDEQTIEKLRQEKNALMENLSKADRDIRAAEDARNKAEDQVSSLQDTEKTLHAKIDKLDSDLLSAQERIRELENDLNKRLAEPELKTYNVNVVESEPVLESAPPGFSFGDDMLKDENEMLRKKVEELSEKVKRIESKNTCAVFNQGNCCKRTVLQ